MLLSSVMFSGCGKYKIVDLSEYEVIKKVEFEKLKKDADIGRSVGRYQLQTIGYRTWKLDTVTGKTCLYLASEQDWKNNKMVLESCAHQGF